MKFRPFTKIDFIKIDSVVQPYYIFPPLLPKNERIVQNLPNICDSTKFSKEEYLKLTLVLGNYSNFKKNFLNLCLNDELPDLGLPKAAPGGPNLFHKNMDGTSGFSMTGPVTLLYNAFSKEEKSKRKVAVLIAYDPIQKRINAKYNSYNIEHWTGLKGEKLTKFVLYCNFDDNFLAEVNEYDLIVTIDIKLKEFIALNDSCNKRF